MKKPVSVLLSIVFMLGMIPGANASLRFKWADNYTDGDIYSFCTRGDAAPYGRLNRVYTGVYA